MISTLSQALEVIAQKDSRILELVMKNDLIAQKDAQIAQLILKNDLSSGS